MIFKPTKLIAETFDRLGVKNRISEEEGRSSVETWLTLTDGPRAIVSFASAQNYNDVGVRVYIALEKVPPEKRSDVLEACNDLNGSVRYLTFYLDKESRLFVDGDIPVYTADGDLGMCCFEYLMRIMVVLETRFHVLAEVL